MTSGQFAFAGIDVTQWRHAILGVILIAVVSLYVGYTFLRVSKLPIPEPPAAVTPGAILVFSTALIVAAAVGLVIAATLQGGIENAPAEAKRTGRVFGDQYSVVLDRNYIDDSAILLLWQVRGPLRGLAVILAVIAIDCFCLEPCLKATVARSFRSLRARGFPLSAAWDQAALVDGGIRRVATSGGSRHSTARLSFVVRRVPFRH